MKNILGAVVGPLLYAISPHFVGKHAVRGFMKRLGVDVARIPWPVCDDLAADAYRMSGLIARGGGRPRIVEFTKTLELYAMQVYALLYLEDRSDSFLSHASRVRAALDRHGVAYPAIIASTLARPKTAN